MNPAQASFEAARAELKLALEWLKGFGLFIVLTDGGPKLGLLRQRLSDAWQVRTRLVQKIAPQDPSSALSEVLQAVFSPPARMQTLGAPIWLELSQDAANAVWNATRKQILAALNQFRGLLEHQVKRPLLLLLPPAYGPLLVQLATDLWSIRQLVVQLPSLPTAAEPDLGQRDTWSKKLPDADLIIASQAALAQGQVKVALQLSERALDKARASPTGRAKKTCCHQPECSSVPTRH